MGSLMDKDTTPNALIEYTQWLSKRLAVVLLVLVVLGLIGWGVVWFINTKIPMISIQCEAEKIRSVKGKLSLFYMVQKERFSEIPYAIYFGADSRRDFHKHTDVKDIVLGPKFDDSTDDYYLFGNNSDPRKYRINRKTLMVEMLNTKNQPLKGDFPIKNCKMITSEQFYAMTGVEVTRRKKGLKF